MRRQFVALFRPAAGAFEETWQRLTAKVMSFPDLKCVRRSDASIILTTSAMPAPASTDSVLVLGDVFSGRSAWKPSESDFRTIARSNGAEMLSAFWGEYIAFVFESGGSTHIVRDPSGALPAYLTTIEGIQVLASDAEQTRRLRSTPPELNSRMIAYAMAFEGLKSTETCVTGVSEILPGTRTTLTGDDVEVHAHWTPWMFADRQYQMTRYDDAVSLVREAVTTTVAAWGSRCDLPIVELSGGLDSSIVATSLCRVCPTTIAMTLLMADPRADERRYARLVANDAGCALMEVPLLVEYADIRKLPQATTFRPGHGVLATASDLAISRATPRGADSFFGGAGGDDVFCYLSTAGSVADALISSGPGFIFLRSISELASIHAVTSWKAGWYGLKKALRGPRVFPPQYQFLSDACAEMAFEHHPWLRRHGNVLPGKFEHVMSLVGAQTRGEGKDRSNIAPIRLPLLSQPVMEACLRVPSWMWTQGGRDRAVARDAFGSALPAAITNRRTKGDFASFNWDVYARNQPDIRDLLLNGYLRKSGLLDPVAIEAHLDMPEPHRSPSYSRLVRLAAIEAWCADWS